MTMLMQDVVFSQYKYFCICSSMLGLTYGQDFSLWSSEISRTLSSGVLQLGISEYPMYANKVLWNTLGEQQNTVRAKETLVTGPNLLNLFNG